MLRKKHIITFALAAMMLFAFVGNALAATLSSKMISGGASQSVVSDLSVNKAVLQAVRVQLTKNTLTYAGDDKKTTFRGYIGLTVATGYMHFTSTGTKASAFIITPTANTASVKASIPSTNTSHYAIVSGSITIMDLT